jgi:ribose-phosphate pyrophosphokinase
MADEITFFAGSAGRALADGVTQALHIPLGAASVERLPDGELRVQLLQPVRRKNVFLLLPTSPPVNDHLVELLAFTDACRRAAASHITAIVPYFGYARSDKRHGRREPIAASMVAACLQVIGVDHVVTVDLHSSQIEGFFHVPVDNLTAVPTLCDALRSRLPEGTVVVSPDAGRVKTATAYARRLGTRVIVLHKERESGTETHVTHVVGDVRDRPCLIIDDMISTGGTLVESIAALTAAGARPEMFVAATHGLFVGDARERLRDAGVREVWVTDTVPQPDTQGPQFRVVSVAPLIASAIGRFLMDGSLSDLF